jgi:hypothetical protein
MERQQASLLDDRSLSSPFPPCIFASSQSCPHLREGGDGSGVSWSGTTPLRRCGLSPLKGAIFPAPLAEGQLPRPARYSPATGGTLTAADPVLENMHGILCA